MFERWYMTIHIMTVLRPGYHDFSLQLTDRLRVAHSGRVRSHSSKAKSMVISEWTCLSNKENSWDNEEKTYNGERASVNLVLRFQSCLAQRRVKIKTKGRRRSHECCAFSTTIWGCLSYGSSSVTGSAQRQLGYNIFFPPANCNILPLDP